MSDITEYELDNVAQVIIQERRKKHQLGDIWKEGRAWKVQAPGGIMACTTKKLAESWSALIRGIHK